MLKTIAIVGASGIVGERIFRLLKLRGFEKEEIQLYAGETEGRSLTYDGKEYEIRPVSTANFKEIDIAFFTAGGGPSIEYAQIAADSGCLVIDNTNEFRMREDVPLIVPQVNFDDLVGIPASNIIANPNCSTIPFVRAIANLDKKFRIKEAVVSTYQAVSGAGKSGIDELLDGSRAYLAGTSFVAKTFDTGIAFDLIPSIDSDLPTGSTVEELKMRQESRKILDRPGLKVLTTCVRVPVVNCHSAAVYLKFEESVELNKVLEVLENSEEMIVYSGKGIEGYPQPTKVSGTEQVHVGRVRVDNEDNKILLFWVVSDNLLIGAALNAVQILEKMRNKGWL